jgi:hypothetical protein
MDAVAWAAGPEGRAAGIRVINLSLAGYVDPAAAGGRGSTAAGGHQGVCLTSALARCINERRQLVACM